MPVWDVDQFFWAELSARSYERLALGSQLRSAHWLRLGLGEIEFAVNVAQSQFASGRLCELLAEALAASRLRAKLLVVEITESMLMDEAEGVRATRHEIKSLGVTLSIDDFGTGYSSLSYLERLPIGELKVDCSFLKDLPDGSTDMATPH